MTTKTADVRPRVPNTRWDLADRFEGARLRALRQAAGYGRGKFAHRLGTDKRSVWRWEADRFAPGQHYAERICEVLECGPEDLLRPGRPAD